MISARYLVPLVLGRIAQDSSERAILSFGQAAAADPVLRFANTVRWVCLDDAGLHGIGQDATQQTDGPRGGADASPHNRFAA
jgi:hypothetical protein